MDEAQTIDATTSIIEATRALAPLIADCAPEMVAARRLPLRLVEELRKLGAFRMAVPKIYGGLELDPMTQVRVVEELSRMDGSVGWCAMISTAGSFMGAFLAPEVAQRLCGHKDFSIAGQAIPTGRADVAEGGYRVSGRFRLGSGCHHASVISGPCVVFKGGKPRQRDGDTPEVRTMLFSPSAVRILDTWYATGLSGTGSNDFLVEDVFVPSEESVSFLEPPFCHGPLYRFYPLFLVSHAGVPLGLARAAIEAVVELSQPKEGAADPYKFAGSRPLYQDSRAHEAIAVGEGALLAARSFAYSCIEDLWSTLCRNERLSPRQRALYRIMLIQVHRVAKDVVTSMYDLAATRAIYRTSPLDRIMRDITTACQHGVVHPRMYRVAGRLLLGLKSGDASV
jgi:alkylation response protein AidB-like acyl-CoA dehydrogenase